MFIMIIVFKEYIQIHAKKFFYYEYLEGSSLNAFILYV